MAKHGRIIASPCEERSQATQPLLSFELSQCRADGTRCAGGFHLRSEVTMAKRAVEVPIRDLEEPLGLAVSVVPKTGGAKHGIGKCY